VKRVKGKRHRCVAEKAKVVEMRNEGWKKRREEKSIFNL